MNDPWCRSRLGVVELYGQHLPEVKEMPLRDRDGKQIKTFNLAANPTTTVSTFLSFATAVSETSSWPCNHPRCRIRLGVVQLHGEPLPEEKEMPVRSLDGNQIETLHLGANSTPTDSTSLTLATRPGKEAHIHAIILNVEADMEWYSCMGCICQQRKKSLSKTKMVKRS